MTAVMTLSSFRALPREGHLDRVKRVYNYLMNYRFLKIRFDTREPNHENVVVKKYDWSNTYYGNSTEGIPSNAPKPEGK